MGAMPNCPWGSGLAGDECCGRFLRGPDQAPTAEALMRSRYTAYVRRDGAYLRRTWHPDTRPARIEFDPTLRWDSLEVLARTGGGLFDRAGTVPFAAHYTRGGPPAVPRETSRFVPPDGAWVYLGA